MELHRLNEELRLMRQLIREDPAVLAQFDRDGNGAVDGAEWDRVRRLVIDRLDAQVENAGGEEVVVGLVANEVFDAEFGGRSLAAVAASATVRSLGVALLAGVLYLLGLASFWGGFAYVAVAELIAAAVVLVYPAPRAFRPIVELIAVCLAPLLSLAVTLWGPFLAGSGGDVVDGNVQHEIIDAAFLYICYVPYGILRILALPVFFGRR